jgi:hypothetical protein
MLIFPPVINKGQLSRLILRRSVGKINGSYIFVSNLISFASSESLKHILCLARKIDQTNKKEGRRSKLCFDFKVRL